MSDQPAAPTTDQPAAPPTWADLAEMASARLGGNRREARWLVEHATGLGWGELQGGRSRPTDRAEARLAALVERRKRGEPLQYVLGSWPFRSLELMVDPRVLIPRPETEQVVEVALTELDRLRADREPGRRATVVDLGTGSGAIALAVATERPRTDVWAVDASADAVAVARANLAGMAGFAATRVRVVEGDWWAGLPPLLQGRVDMVVSNPPYIATAEMAGLDEEVKGWEPQAALEAGPTGLEAVERILADAPHWLSDDGVAVLEIAPHQAERVTELAARAGFARAEVRPDLAGRNRALVAARRP